MRTSRQIYDQVLWDPRLDASEFVIGYEARCGAPDELPLLEWRSASLGEPEVEDTPPEIPWHRVLYVRRGPERVWDRAARIDRL